jgi:hypothetical protein
MAADKRYHNVANRRDCRSKNCNYQGIEPLGSTQLTTLQPQFITLQLQFIATPALFRLPFFPLERQLSPFKFYIRRSV